MNFENYDELINFIINTNIIKYTIKKKLLKTDEDLEQNILIIFLNKDLFYLNKFSENEFKGYITNITKNQIHDKIRNDNNKNKKHDKYLYLVDDSENQTYDKNNVEYCNDEFYNFLREYKNVDIFNNDDTYIDICNYIDKFLTIDEKKLLYKYINSKNLRELSKEYECSHTFISKKINLLKNKIKNNICL